MLTKLLHTDGFNNIVRGKNGWIVYNKNDMFIGRAVEKYGEFSETEVFLFKQICKPGAFVMDIGANIGMHSMALSKIVGPDGFVFAFEPQAVVFQTLCANMAINSITNVECMQAIVTNHSGFAKMPRLDYSIESNFGGVRVEEINYGIKIIEIKIDEYFDFINRLDFVKIDVEGMELKVIEGAENLIKKFKPYLYVENDQVDKSKALLTKIKELGYNSYWHLPALYNPKNFAQDREDLFPGIVSINMLCIPDHINAKMKDFVLADDVNFHPFAERSGE